MKISTRQNRILNALPRSELHALAAQLKPVTLERNQIIYRPGERFSHIYFPTTSVLSVVALLGDGAAVETTTIGSEGILGAIAVIGADRSPEQALCQIAGDAHRMPLSAFKAHVKHNGVLKALAQRYCLWLFSFMGQSIACNRFHTLFQRCARCLLLTEDRTSSNQLPITQELLAIMLGVHRPAVSVAARELEMKGLIRRRRGQITITSRRGLENAACECYKLNADELKRLLRRPRAG